jgi:hypothetical protein
MTIKIVGEQSSIPSLRILDIPMGQIFSGWQRRRSEGEHLFLRHPDGLICLDDPCQSLSNINPHTVLFGIDFYDGELVLTKSKHARV